MILRHSFALTLSNIMLICKVFIYSAVITCLGVAVFISVSTPILEAVGGDFNLMEMVDHLAGDVLKGDGAFFDRIIASLDHLSTNHSTEIVEIVVMGIIVVFLVKFGFNLVIPTVSYVVNQKMASNYNEGFFHSVASVGLKGLAFSSLYTLISLPIDLGITVLTFYLSKWLTQGLGMFGIICAVLLAIIVITLRMCVMGGWTATFINEDIKFSLKFKRGMRLGFTSLKALFPSILTLNVAAFGVITATAIPTFFIIPLAVPPMVIVSFAIMSNVNYYVNNGKKFYIDERVI